MVLNMPRRRMEHTPARRQRITVQLRGKMRRDMVLQLESALHIMVLKKGSKLPDMAPPRVPQPHTMERQKARKQQGSAQRKARVPRIMAQKEQDSAPPTDILVQTVHASEEMLSVWAAQDDSAVDAVS
jgi:hypothetical protein